MWHGTIKASLIAWLTPCDRVTHICVSKLNIIGSGNGLSPGRHQVFIWTIAGILLNWFLAAKFGEMLIEIYTSSFSRMLLKSRLRNGGYFCEKVFNDAYFFNKNVLPYNQRPQLIWCIWLWLVLIFVVRINREPGFILITTREQVYCAVCNLWIGYLAQ